VLYLFGLQFLLLVLQPCNLVVVLVLDYLLRRVCEIVEHYVHQRVAALLLLLFLLRVIWVFSYFFFCLLGRFALQYQNLFFY